MCRVSGYKCYLLLLFGMFQLLFHGDLPEMPIIQSLMCSGDFFHRQSLKTFSKHFRCILIESINTNFDWPVNTAVVKYIVKIISIRLL